MYSEIALIVVDLFRTYIELGTHIHSYERIIFQNCQSGLESIWLTLKNYILMLDRGIYPVIFISLYVWFDELEVELRSLVLEGG